MATLVRDAPLEVVGHQFITSLATAVALTVPAGSVSVLLQAETKNVRWRADGTAPTASVGNVLYAGTSTEFLPIKDLTKIKLIEVEASAKVNVTYLA